MAYSSGILKYRVTIYNKVAKDGFGETTQYEPVITVHADETWNKGVKSLREGSLDAMDVVIFRMRWNNYVTRDSILECMGKRYQVLSLHADKQDNIVQITAQEINK